MNATLVDLGDFPFYFRFAILPPPVETNDQETQLTSCLKYLKLVVKHEISETLGMQEQKAVTTSGTQTGRGPK